MGWPRAGVARPCLHKSLQSLRWSPLMNLNRCLFGLIFLVAVGQGVSVRAGLVGQWLFEEGAGTSAVDTSSHGRDGTITNGATYVAGLYPGSHYALQMNSAGPNSPNLAAAQSVLLPSDANYIRNAPAPRSRRGFVLMVA